MITPRSSHSPCTRAAACLLALLACLSIARVSRADSLPEQFARGNAAFARGDYGEAVSAYEALVEAGVDDPDLAFNLASAYASHGQYGQAIRYFQRALRLAPRDEGARNGLRQARETLGERQAQAHGEAIVVDRPPLTEAIFASFSADFLAAALLIAAWVAVGLFLLLRRETTRAEQASLAAHAEGLRLGLGIASALALALALLAGLGLGAKLDWGRAGVRAVVLQESAALREGPDERARLVSELVEGEAVRVLAREGRFTRVAAREGVTGYLRAEQVGEI